MQQPAGAERTGKKKKVELKRSEDRNIIAEIKRQSPSRGVLRGDIFPEALAEQYIRGGAKAISVLTDAHFFGGSVKDLEKVAAIAGDIPLLRKDFIIHEAQIQETARLGADLVLLIARILGKEELKNFIHRSKELGLVPLVEIHDPWELDNALNSGAEVLGINNRDLRSFHVDISVSEKLLPMIPEEKIRVVESGIHCLNDMERLEDLGADAFLIGEALVLADDPEEKLKIFRGKK